MRKLIVVTFMSLDGFYEGPGKDVMALPMDITFSEYNLERMQAAVHLAIRSSPSSTMTSRRSLSQITPRFLTRDIPGRIRQG
jgi:hypothetical protein